MVVESQTLGLYNSVLGREWADLAPPIRRFHEAYPTTVARGRFSVLRGRSPIARMLATIMRLPDANPATDLRLEVVRNGEHEHWRRDFGNHLLETTQTRANGGRGLREQFGPLEFAFAIEVTGGSLVHVQRATVLVAGPIRIPLPRWCAPRIAAREDPEGDRVKVSVRVEAPGAGMLVSYDGVITVDMPVAAAPVGVTAVKGEPA